MTDIFHIYWKYADTPARVPADNMWVARTDDEAQALESTAQHAAGRRPDVAIVVTKIERWRAVPGLIGCEVSSLDRVRFTRNHIPRFMPTVCVDGESSVFLFVDGTHQLFTIASLSARAFSKEYQS